MEKRVLLFLGVLLLGALGATAQKWSHYDDFTVPTVRDVNKDGFGNLYVTTCYEEGWELLCDMYRWNRNDTNWLDTVRGEGAHIDNTFMSDSDPDGNFWLVTPNGMFKYDGIDYSYVKGLPKSDHLPLEMSIDKNGDVWYSGVSGGGSFYTGAWSNGGWNDHSAKFNTDPVDFMKTSPKGLTWVYTTGNLVNATENLEQYSIDLEGRFPFTCVFDTLDRPVIVLPNFGDNSKSNLLRFENGILTPIDHGGLGTGFYQHAIWGSDNNIYVASLGNGIRVIDDEKVVSYTEAEGLPSDTVLDILEDSEGDIWIATAAGIAKLEQGTLKTTTTILGISDIRVQEVIEMARGDLWFGTNKGMFRYQWLFDGLRSEEPSGLEAAVRLQSESKQLQMYTATDASVHYQVVDVKGSVVAEGDFVQQTKRSLTQIPQGVYMVQLTSGQEFYSQRIMIR